MNRILLVEDEPSIALAIEDDLRREGYEVDLATDGQEACRRGTSTKFDLILLDVMLPKKDGYEVCRYLRQAGVQAPILMLTARGQESDKVMGLEIGADDYITKPYGPRELRARIHAHLRRSNATADAIHRFAAFELNTARCELTRNGSVIDLKPLEYRLLLAFLQREGRVLSRQQLIDAAWGDDVHVTERVVDTQVTNLRKKIEPDPEHPQHLVSLRGMGYRFDAKGVTEA